MARLTSFTFKNSQARWGKQTPAVIILLGVIAIAQVCYHAYMMSRIRHIEEHDQLYDACGGDGSSEKSESYQCLEQRIYTGWQEESRLEEQELILKSTQMTAHEDHHRAHVDRVVDAVAQAAAGRTAETLWEEHKSTIHAQIEAQHEALPADEREKAREIHAVHGDRLLDSTLTAVHSNVTSESVEDIKQRLLSYQLDHERQRQERAEKLRKEREERQLEFDKIFDKTMAAIHAPPTPSPWAQNLLALQAHYDELSKSSEEHKQQVQVSKKEAQRLKNSGFLASQTIRWQPVTQWQVARESPGEQDAGLVIASWEDLHPLTWSGARPHAACIAMVPPTTDSVYRMMYFVDNWKLQDWESKELVLVYPHNDTRLAKVVQKFADGKSVKAVASRDSEFPSTAAIRFGAWSVKADVIARWDFDEWHHPERLTLQIKALAMTSRPASLLQPKGTHGAKATDREATIVGEAKWMREEWYPFLKHGSDILEEDRSHHIVQVDAPKLDINAKTSTPVPFAAGLDAERAEIGTGVAICMKLSKGEHRQFTVSLGALPIPELERDHEHLTQTHHDVDARLDDLCSKADAEASLLKRAELHRQVARLSSFEAEIASELSNPTSAVLSVHPLSPLEVEEH